MTYEQAIDKAKHTRPAAFKHALNLAIWMVMINGSTADQAAGRAYRIHGASKAEIKRKLERLGVV